MSKHEKPTRRNRILTESQPNIESPLKPVIPSLNILKLNAATTILFPNTDIGVDTELRSLTERGVTKDREYGFEIATERHPRNRDDSLTNSSPIRIKPIAVNRDVSVGLISRSTAGMNLWLDSIRLDSSNVKKLPEYEKVSALAAPGQGSNIDISHKKFGDQRVFILTSALRGNGNIRSLNVRDNRLTDRGFSLIFTELRENGISNLEMLDLSDNSIKRQGCESLVRFVASCQGVRRLCLHNMGIDNSATKKIAHGLRGSNIVSLQLRNNNIEDTGAVAIANYLNSNHDCHLTELDLSWNQIKCSGGCAIAFALQSNKSLESLDISWNALASTGLRTSDRSFAKQISDMFAVNVKLLHLDISNNHLTTADCVAMSEGLKKNHTLLGLHMVGNEGRIDSYGELVPDATPWPLEAGHTATRIIGGSVVGREDWSLRSNCWICGGWRERKFSYALTEEDLCRILKCSPAHLGRDASGPSTSLDIYAQFSTSAEAAEAQDSIDSFAQWEKKALFIIRTTAVHLLTSFDRWVPESMHLVEPGAVNLAVSPRERVRGRFVFELFRMVPPGRLVIRLQ